MVVLMDAGRRPISPEERPGLLALGQLVVGLRREFGLSQAQLGHLAGLTGGHVSAIERGRRRTRRSTLERMVAAVVADEDRRAVIVDELVEAAGAGLALEEDEAQRRRIELRLERRRRRAERADLDATVRMTDQILRTARRLNKPNLVERLEADLARLRALVVERDNEAARRDREKPLPRRPDKGPAWHALQDYARSLLPPGRTGGQLHPTPAQQARLAELKAAAEAEEADHG